ncbi:MAG: glycosyltransferase family 2 protein [Candidatus Aenigmatarchaeota archaeon]|nr:MAG: glycosyltransferase family 2 protein [Candidatus Aenigmarchaeota archaeon]
MYKGRTVSVAIPAYNEEKAIARVIRDFKKPYVDELIVVDNNSKDRTADFARRAGARVVRETKQGYGHAIMRGMREAKGDWIVVVDADSTYVADDMEKLFAYTDVADLVLCTRVTRELVEPGASMGPFLFYGNLFIGKLMELRFGRKIKCTDLGCTFRLVKRTALKKIISKLYVGGAHFSPHMRIVAMENGLKVIEIPIRYRARVGESKLSGTNIPRSFMLGLKMIKLILTT